MDFDRFTHLKDFSFTKHFGITTHSFKLDVDQLRISEIMNDVDKDFRKIKCTVITCENDVYSITGFMELKFSLFVKKLIYN